jgi:hypothetical protein
MEYQDCLIPALERVLAWDLPDDFYGDALAHEAEVMAGVDPDHSGCTWDA